MRKSGGLLIPMSLILAYYAFWVAVMWVLLTRFPGIERYLPVGGIEELADSNTQSFEPVYSSFERTILAPAGALRLLVSCAAAIVLIVPVTWAYFITSRQSRIDQSFLQTMVILPIVVAGISMIVVNSLALAFSLAGVVAAVRFRFSLKQPSDAMYIFCAIGIGLGCGIAAVGVSSVISFAFVATTLCIWRLEYGKTLAGPFLTMITRRDHGEDEY